MCSLGVVIDGDAQKNKGKLKLKLQIRFFNVTNPVEMQLGAIPVLEEVGPYVYW